MQRLGGKKTQYANEAEQKSELGKKKSNHTKQTHLSASSLPPSDGGGTLG